MQASTRTSFPGLDPSTVVCIEAHIVGRHLLAPLKVPTCVFIGGGGSLGRRECRPTGGGDGPRSWSTAGEPPPIGGPLSRIAEAAGPACRSSRGPTAAPVLLARSRWEIPTGAIQLPTGLNSSAACTGFQHEPAFDWARRLGLQCLTLQA